MVRVDIWEDDAVYYFHKDCYKGNRGEEEDPNDYFDLRCFGCGREIS